MTKKWILLLSIFLTACGFEGDGIYEESGFWPLTTHNLQLPAFNFESDKEVLFKFDGYGSHGTSFLSINLISDTPVNFEKLNTILEVRVYGGNNVTYFYRKSALNSHFLRMQKIGEAAWANEMEWNGRYEYSSPDIKNRAVPFSISEVPYAAKEMTYIHSLPTGKEAFSIYVKIGDVPEGFENLQINLGLSSGWK
ncbi:hypothetical protein [Alishewanella sp. SMS8]|uniref:hypothetical protein n=1 Tax=Alishewanella sp. SMS8 TaxID=2994676 RepID=UPI002741CC0C|nr:hypothetical protein [Alishewanella sp. SMS8]MDP5460481.1 hypothetical protein [Alishewanella sp. SMS8]